MRGRQITVSLAGKDLIVDTEAVGRYLARDHSDKPPTDDWKHQAWKGQGLDILWFNELDHAQVFDSRSSYGRLVNVIREYSLESSTSPGYAS